MHDHEHTAPGSPGLAPTRRAVVAGTGLLATAALAGCSSYGDQSAQGGADPAAGYPAGQVPPPVPLDPPAASSGAALASTSDVPVGGGQVFAEEEIVVTQAAPGDFRAFSAVCPHQGCTVNEVEGGTINCPCHGSKFDVADGSVVNGPAQRALDSREVVVEGDQIRVV